MVKMLFLFVELCMNYVWTISVNILAFQTSKAIY